MKLFFTVGACLAAATQAADAKNGTNWVVIAAGSSGYGNYRHQADACHAYQVVKAGGVPEDQIILMMEDDIADSTENPFKGKMFNKPTKKGTPGKDVYDGCDVAYKGKVVTAKLFLDVLTGNEAGVPAGGKVLKSGPNDKVFVNFVDHGGTGIVEFPNGDFLHASALNKALTKMHTNNMYDKLVFYMEACESGSMFDVLLPKDINVYATTASNAKESSWGTYCPPDDKVDGKEMNTCLGDLYSVNWMEDADTQTGMARTLHGQYEYVVSVTNKSHPKEYGTKTYAATDLVKEFLGPSDTSKKTTTDDNAADAVTKRPVNERDVELLQDFYKYFRADSQGKTAEEKQALADQLIDVVNARQAADARFAALPDIVAGFEPDFETTDAIDADCVEAAYTTYQSTCGEFDSYSLKYTHEIADLCTTYTTDTIQAIVTAVCK